MKQRRHGDQGFTLLEIIVVLAVLGALAAMLSPVFFRYIDDANRARAQGDANTIAAAIQQMYKDTGRWAFYVSGGAAEFAYDSAADATALSSDADCVGTADGTSTQTNSCATNTPSGGTGWAFTRTDSLTRQLITNAPSYTATGPRAWRGPYLDRVPPTDPWGRSYVVNIDGAPNDATPIVVMVLSAGPDGVIDTVGNTAATGANPEAGNDDIIARVR